MIFREKPITEIAVEEKEIERTLGNNASHGECLFLAAGRMIYRKGFAFLLDALERVPEDSNYKFQIVGGGPELNRLRARGESSEKLSKHVSFSGVVSYETMKQKYQSADVFVMPSIRETTGTVLMEAMANGLPIITINKFGGSVLLDSNTGWLYDGDTKEDYIEGLKNAIVDCICRPDEVARRGQNALEKARMYTWQKKNAVYQRIYADLLAKDTVLL